MSWKLTGDLRSTGMPGVLMWDDDLARLGGSSEALADVAAFCLTNERVWLTPTGPTLPADRTDEVAALAIAYELLSHVDVTGDPPELPIPDVPDGAIA